jgi:hypothetical protein
MRFLVKHRPSPAMVVACLALSVSLAGSGYAAIKLPKNSVGTKQLKKHAVTSPKIKNDAVTGVDVKEASLGTVPSATNATNATNAANATNSANATNATTATNALQLGGKGAADVVRWAAVTNVGGTPSIARGFGVVSASRFGGAGQIEVRFDRDIRACAWLATRADVTVDNAWGTVPGGSVVTAKSYLSNDTVFTESYDAAGTRQDRSLFVAVLC